MPSVAGGESGVRQRVIDSTTVGGLPAGRGVADRGGDRGATAGSKTLGTM